jgi:hypothetical protein
MLSNNELILLFYPDQNHHKTFEKKGVKAYICIIH